MSIFDPCLALTAAVTDLTTGTSQLVMASFSPPALVSMFWRTLQAAFSLAGVLLVMAQTSPPIGAMTVWPWTRVGMPAVPYCRPLTVLSEGTSHGPLIIMAALPEANSEAIVVWSQLVVSLEAEPSLTRSVQSVRACTAGVALRLVRLPPLLHRNGSNCQAALPLVGWPAKAMP